MALWALWNSNSFSAAVSKAVNLLGDADTASWQALLARAEVQAVSDAALTCLALGLNSQKAVSGWKKGLGPIGGCVFLAGDGCMMHGACRLFFWINGFL